MGELSDHLRGRGSLAEKASAPCRGSLARMAFRNGFAADRGGRSEPAPEAAQPFGARPEGRLVDLTKFAVHGLLLMDTVIVSSNDAELPFAATRPSLVHFANPEPFPTTLARMSLLPPGTGFRSRFLLPVVEQHPQHCRTRECDDLLPDGEPICPLRL